MRHALQVTYYKSAPPAHRSDIVAFSLVVHALIVVLVVFVTAPHSLCCWPAGNWLVAMVVPILMRVWTCHSRKYVNEKVPEYQAHVNRETGDDFRSRWIFFVFRCPKFLIVPYGSGNLTDVSGWILDQLQSVPHCYTTCTGCELQTALSIIQSFLPFNVVTTLRPCSLCVPVKKRAFVCW